MGTLALDLSPSLGMELIGKQALALLKEGLNNELEVIRTEWDSLDDQLGHRRVRVERIEDDNFYHGHRPSLVDAPVDKYPNCSVMCYNAQPTPYDFDHINQYQLRLYVELMCKSDEDEGEVNSRIQRTADAAHRVLMRERTLKGLVSGIANQPTVVLTDVFVRPEHRGGGRRFLWQGARLEYAILKQARIDD